MSARRTLATTTLIGASLLSACSANSTSADSSASDPATNNERQRITVFAAASLNAAGAELEQAFEKEHNVDLTISF